MPGSHPQETFREAREACRNQDWEGLYACLAPSSVRRLIANSLHMLVGRAGTLNATALKRICQEVDTDTAWVDEWAVRRDRILDSYAELRTSRSVGDELRRLAGLHRELILRDKRETERMFRALPDVPRLAAALEREMRRVRGGGSLSSRLFVDETLHEVVIGGKRATGLRRTARGQEMEIEFEEIQGRWFIRVP